MYRHQLQEWATPIIFYHWAQNLITLDAQLTSSAIFCFSKNVPCHFPVVKR